MTTRYLDVSGGRVAYDDTGAGPLVACLPGFGDMRGSYRYLMPRLVAAGYRVVTMDLRGHGESSIGWPDYSGASIAGDLLALVRALDAAPAVLVGNSYGGAAVAYAAALDPSAVAGLVLLDAFVRDVPPTLVQRVGGWLVARLGTRLWAPYYRSLYPSTPPPDLDAYIKALTANLNERGRFDAVRAMMSGKHPAIAQRLADVRAPVLIVMGAKDPDFADAAVEARLIAGELRHAARVDVQVIAGAGHYPHAEMPDATAQVILSFLRATHEVAQHGA